LLAELEQSRAALAETETLRSSLSVDYVKLEEECAGLCTAVDTLGLEKTEAVNEVATVHAKFQEYRVCHRKKLC
jgi:hypothetical protein